MKGTRFREVVAVKRWSFEEVSVYSDTSLKRPPKGPANSGRYREVVRIGSVTLTCAKKPEYAFIDLLFFNFVI